MSEIVPGSFLQECVLEKASGLVALQQCEFQNVTLQCKFPLHFTACRGLLSSLTDDLGSVLFLLPLLGQSRKQIESPLC